MSKLVIAEKPSVALSLAKVLGAYQRQDGYMKGNGYPVSWCVRLMPGERDAKEEMLPLMAEGEVLKGVEVSA